MNEEDEVEQAHRAELRHMVKYWKERALRAEKHLQIACEVSAAATHLHDRMRCESDIPEVRCNNCTCWKGKKIDDTDEP